MICYFDEFQPYQFPSGCRIKRGQPQSRHRTLKRNKKKKNILKFRVCCPSPFRFNRPSPRILLPPAIFFLLFVAERWRGSENFPGADDHIILSVKLKAAGTTERPRTVSCPKGRTQRNRGRARGVPGNEARTVYTCRRRCRRRRRRSCRRYFYLTRNTC